MKKLNLVVYLPGYVGSFITYILSLDDDTFPWIPLGKTLPADTPRKNLYSFKRLQDKDALWIEHHLNLVASLELFVDTDNSYNTATCKVHPSEYYQKTINRIANFKNDIQIRYISMHGSPQIVEDHVHSFIERNGGVPAITPEEQAYFDKFINEHDTYKIYIDFLFSTENDFVNGYTKICSDLGIRPKVEDALEMYIDWRAARSVNRVTEKNTNEVLLNRTVESLYNWAAKYNLLNEVFGKDGIFPTLANHEVVVRLGGIEPPAFRLSGECSNP